jgi:hypothetical protein
MKRTLQNWGKHLITHFSLPMMLRKPMTPHRFGRKETPTPMIRTYSLSRMTLHSPVLVLLMLIGCNG